MRADSFRACTLFPSCAAAAAPATLAQMNLFSSRYRTICWTPSGIDVSAVLMCSSGFSGASYGAETPVNSAKGREVVSAGFLPPSLRWGSQAHP